MIRDVGRLSGEEFDLAVVGGGVYGVCAAWRAALNGLRVCLVERNDFGGATSSNSLKVIHGGLRYLQHLDFKRMRESIRERSVLMHMAPHLVAPMPFIIPTYGHGMKGREVHALALRMNDWVSWDRNRGLDPGLRLPPGRTLSRAEMLERFPGLRENGLTGGALWYDGLSYDSERLLLAFLLSAVRAGAVVANHVSAEGFVERDGAVAGVLAKDALTGRDLTVRARMVLNAAGPWVDDVLGRLPSPPPARAFHPSKAINLVTRKLFDGVALGLHGTASFRDTDAAIDKGFRLFFVIPWQGCSLIGTRHFSYGGGPDALGVSRDEVGTVLDEVNAAYPPARLTPGDVIGVYRGVLPRDPDTPDTGDVQLEKHYRRIDHEAEHGIPGLVTVVGVKWTTARQVAFETVDFVCGKLGRGTTGPPPASAVPLAGSPAEDLASFLARGIDAAPSGVSRESAEHVLRCHGTEAERVFRLVLDDGSLGRPVVEGFPVVGAQVVHAARREMAPHLDDVVLRRTGLGTAPGLGVAEIEACARLVQDIAGWSPSDVRRQVDRALEAVDALRGRGGSDDAGAPA